MKNNYKLFKLVPVICTILLTGYANSQDANPCRTGGQTCYFGVEINGTLCGYSVDTYCDGILSGKKIRYEYSDVTLKMSALGANMDGGFKYMHAYDPGTGRTESIEVSVINGESEVRFITKVLGDTAFYSSPTSGVNKSIPLDSDVVIYSQAWYPHLFNDFIRNSVIEKKYKIYDPIKGEISEKVYNRKYEEKTVLGDSVFQTLVIEETDFSTGLKTTLWINKADGFNVKSTVGGRSIYLTDKSVTGKIMIADLDKEFFCTAGKTIPEFMSLSWMKVRVQINSYGENLKVETLNLPGQKFSGTVNGSFIDGIFEIEPASYKGNYAPPFPPDFGKSNELKKYLESEIMIESHDPLIISEALRITSGSKDSWEAVLKLSKWVSENIAGVLPGGISAINTLKTKEAECGGHSRLLAAFCRAVGIPARMVVGCMFTNYHSGGFGQHAWTEVYMGQNGWIPVDATISEISYIDAGHIRLGENANFRPVKMEILDFRSDPKNSDAKVPENFGFMAGNYMNLEQYRMFKIVQKENGVAIDIPGRAILDLNPPDDHGKWFPKMTREISITPGNMSDGKAEKMIVYQYFRLKKISPADTGLNEMPEEFRKFAGKYQFAPAKLSLDVMFQDGVLTTQEPLGRSKERIGYMKMEDHWIDKSGTYEIGFAPNIENEVVALNFAVRTEFVRGEPVTIALEPVIKEFGIDAGLKKYEEIKKSHDSEYLFSEHMLHQLGHNLLKEDRIDEAIKVFRKNVEEYPGSFIANDALAETYLKSGNSKQALKCFKKTLKLNPDYEYGRKMIEQLRNK